MAVAFCSPPCKASTNAPDTGKPAAVTVPFKVPVGTVMVKLMPAVDMPLTVTTTGPVVAKFGTGTTMVFVDQLVG